MRCHSRKAPVKGGLLAVAVVFVTLFLRAQWNTPWSYEGARGPDHWGDLDPDYAACKNGTQQSPIDIRNPKKANLLSLRFEYKSSPLRIINNGYTAVRVNYPPGNENVLIVGDVRYELTQFHFHHPSEEQINGRAYDMVIHLMHQSSDGKVVGVAVFVKAGNANTTVQQLWNYMPQTVSPEKEIAGVELNPIGLLPRELGYYIYMGSQSAPPCTEPVTWFVLKHSIDISSEQINAFAKLYPHDVRPIQPLNGRAIRETK